MQEHFNQTVGKRIRTQREYKRMSREKFAEQAEISAQFLADIESGKKGMSAFTLYKISKTLGVSAEALISEAHAESNAAMLRQLDSLNADDLESAELILQTFVRAVTKQR